MKQDPPTFFHNCEMYIPIHTYIYMHTYEYKRKKKRKKRNKREIDFFVTFTDVKMSPLGSYTFMLVILLDSPIWRDYRTF